jgi:hypothetical protein
MRKSLESTLKVFDLIQLITRTDRIKYFYSHDDAKTCGSTYLSNSCHVTINGCNNCRDEGGATTHLSLTMEPVPMQGMGVVRSFGLLPSVMACREENDFLLLHANFSIC